MMDGLRAGAGRLRWLPLVALLGIAVSACESDDDLAGPGRGAIGIDAPDRVSAIYEWVFQGWQGESPRGVPSVELTWQLPAGWNGETFSVYGRRAGQADFTRMATVSSCTLSGCRYVDLNVQPGTTYEYFVTSVDERTGRESPQGSPRASLAVPAAGVPETPGAPRAVGLDEAVFLQWEPTGAERYRVLLESGDPDAPFDIGETDGSGYLDTRAENGSRYEYRLAAVDSLGHVSALGPLVTAIPRPDHQAELIYALADSAAASGFRFVGSDADNPIVPGTAGSAQLRLEVVDGVLSLVPLGETAITSGVFTTALTCGPASDPGCEAIERADDPDAPADFSAEPVGVAAELTYLVRTRGPDGQSRYGKIRVALEGEDQEGRDLVVFDWAYQLIPGEPSLNRK